jgi:hypothetical protein
MKRFSLRLLLLLVALVAVIAAWRWNVRKGIRESQVQHRLAMEEEIAELQEAIRLNSNTHPEAVASDKERIAELRELLAEPD